MPIIDKTKLPIITGSIYPAPYDAVVHGRSSLRLGDAGNLTQFGANLVTLQAGAKSSLRHWHKFEDEFVMITNGACTLVEDQGAKIMKIGDCAAFPANTPNGHHFINHTDKPMSFLVIGTRSDYEEATYSDEDLRVILQNRKPTFQRKDGTPLNQKDSTS